MTIIFVKNTDSLVRLNAIGTPFLEMSETDSSNNYAMRQVQSNMAAHGAVYFTHHQTAGKGQRGRAWNAAPGQNIMMSCVLEPAPLHVENKFVVSAAVALACRNFFAKYAVDEVFIKWPNDIYWKDRKAGGILVENILQGKEWKFAIAGMGININQTLFDPMTANPVSLKQITGKTFDTIFLAKELCGLLEEQWQAILEGHIAAIFSQYNAALYKLNMPVIFRKNNALITAMIKGVNEQGELLTDTGGSQSTLVHGDMEWVITS